MDNEQLFRCIECNHVDMVDLARSEAALAGSSYRPNTCTKCLTGFWHEQFAWLPYVPGKDTVVNPPFSMRD
jgi:hypothetical protein